MNLNYDGTQKAAKILGDANLERLGARFMFIPVGIREALLKAVRGKRYAAKKSWQRGSVRG